MQRETQAKHSVELPAGRAPDWVKLMPSGAFAGRDGRGPYALGDAQAVIDATRAYQSGADLPVDYDHQILWSQKNGQPAPAAGWIKTLEARPDGLWARVEWTAAASGRLAAREYRFVSPVFTHLQDGSVRRICCAALTNTPNLELTAIASQLPEGDASVDKLLQALAALFGLPPEGATEEAVTAHAQQLAAGLAKLPELAKALGAPEDSSLESLAAHAQQARSKLGQSLAGVAKAIGAPEGSSPEQLVAHAATMPKPGATLAAPGMADPSQWVPMSQFVALSDRLAAVEKEGVERAVSEAMKAGKLSPAQREWALAYASQSPAGFAVYLEKAVPVVAPGEQGPNGRPAPKDGLDAEVLAVCSQMGLSPDEFKKTLQAEKEGR